MMQDASSPLPVLSSAYQPLPWLYLGFLAIWAASGFCWASSSWRSRHFQVLSLHFAVLFCFALNSGDVFGGMVLLFFSCMHGSVQFLIMVFLED